MPWGEVTVMSQRQELVQLALCEGVNFSELCKRFEITRTTGYRWVDRFLEEGAAGLLDRSHRPHHSPGQSDPALEAMVLSLRDRFPTWGGRKLRARLIAEGLASPPSASTITSILRRHERLDGPGAGERGAWLRFEHEAPNQLWQMDFKGHFPLLDQRATRCHPLTILDDHSRFNVCLQASLDERKETVQAALKALFRRYGLPLRISADNGSPWGNSNGDGITALGAWLIQLGVQLTHSRPYHPQTQGKDERFHRTLKLELLSRQGFASLAACQAAFDEWRDCYNLIRPHEALGLKPPISRYEPSPRPFPEVLPQIEYGQGEHVRIVQKKGEINFRGREFLISRGLAGLPVAVRLTSGDGCWAVFFCQQQVAIINLASNPLD